MAIPAPAFLLKFFAGKFAKEVLLPSQRIFPEKAAAFPFSFQYKNLGAALDEIYGNQSLLDGKFHAGQFVARSRKEVFSFFSAAENLEAITPPWLNFRILGKSTPEIRENTLIDYKLRIHGVPVRWRTKISKWNPESSFVDEQLKGPYKKWHHLHRFEEVPGGTYILDEVTYRIPGSWIGRALLYWWIRKEIGRAHV